MRDHLFVCEWSVVSCLVSGLWQTCSYGNNRWDASSYKQVNCMFHVNHIYSVVNSSL